MGSHAPGATGTLAATPLSELLIFALEQRLDGSLVFETPDGIKSALALRAGVVKKSRLGSGKHRLGEVCEQLALASSEVIAFAVSRAKGRLFGQVLLEAGLDPGDLDRALREQLRLHIQQLASLCAATVYGYYAGQDFLERWGAERPEVDALALVWQAARSAHNPRIADVMARIAPLGALELHRDSRIGRFGFSARESALLDVLRTKPMSHAQLVELSLLERNALDRVLYVLALTRHLDLGGEAMPLCVDAERFKAGRARAPTIAAASAAVAQPAQKPKSEEHDQRRREVSELAAALDGLDYYELFGVAKDAETNAIQTAFFQLAKRWHPDKLAPDLSDLSDPVTHIFARINEAYKVLTSPAQRAEYDRLSAEGGDTEDDQAKVQQVLRAVIAFQKAEVFMRRGDWASTEKMAAQAHEDDPDQAEYGALFAYARSKSIRDAGGQHDLVAMLNAASDRQPKNMRIKLYRAHVLKQAGRLNDAMRDFRAVAEAEPGNVEAQRELRLFKMRRGDDENKPESGGLLGKLFGKD